MIRDSNNIQGAMNRAAKMGRGGDNQMAHVGGGEAIIPAEVIDQQPQVMGALIKAFQNAGADWRKYLVGSPQAQKNPSTGAQMFPFEGEGIGGGDYSGPTDRESRDGGGGVRGGDPLGGDPGYSGSVGGVGDFGQYNGGGRSLAPGPGFAVDPINFEKQYAQLNPDRRGNYDDLLDATKGFRTGAMFGPPGALVGGAVDVARGLYSAFTGGPGMPDPSKPPGGYPGAPEGRDGGGDRVGGRGLAKDIYSTASPLPSVPVSPLAPVVAPGYLQMDPNMTDLQRRAQIATFGLNADDPRYSAQETQDYYKSLLSSSLSGATSLDSLLPIERQYLEQVLGIQIPDNVNDLQGLLGGQQSPQYAFPGPVSDFSPVTGIT